MHHWDETEPKEVGVGNDVPDFGLDPYVGNVRCEVMRDRDGAGNALSREIGAGE